MTGRVKRKSASTMPSSKPTMRRSWASKASRVAPQSDEDQALTTVVAPRHRAAQHEGLRLELLLSRPLDVRTLGSVVELVVRDPLAADAFVLFRPCHGSEGIKVVLPALHCNNTGAIQAGPPVHEQGGGGGVLAHGVLRAIFVPGEVPARAVNEAGDPVGDLEARQPRQHLAAAQQHLARIPARYAHQQIRGRRRDGNAAARKGRHHSKARRTRSDRCDLNA